MFVCGLHLVCYFQNDLEDLRWSRHQHVAFAMPCCQYAMEVKKNSPQYEENFGSGMCRIQWIRYFVRSYSTLNSFSVLVFNIL